MDYKEKLKAIINSNSTPFVDIDTFLKYFPEFKESEDERIRKGIIHGLKYLERGLCWDSVGGVDMLDALDWLEKQGKQNPAWSEEDKKMTGFIKNAITADEAYTYLENTGIQVIDAQTWLEGLKNRVQPQNTWKPSDEQLKSLQEVIDMGHFTSYPNALETLYEQLKKLKG